MADYRPATVADNKIKKKDGDMAIPLARTKDILAALGESKRPGQFLCGFSMETENMLENSRKKLEKKHLDLIAANNVKVAGAGFAVDTNVLTLIAPDEGEGAAASEQGRRGGRLARRDGAMIHERPSTGPPGNPAVLSD